MLFGVGLLGYTITCALHDLNWFRVASTSVLIASIERFDENTVLEMQDQVYLDAAASSNHSTPRLTRTFSISQEEKRSEGERRQKEERVERKHRVCVCVEV